METTIVSWGYIGVILLEFGVCNARVIRELQGKYIAHYSGSCIIGITLNEKTCMFNAKSRWLGSCPTECGLVPVTNAAALPTLRSKGLGLRGGSLKGVGDLGFWAGSGFDFTLQAYKTELWDKCFDIASSCGSMTSRK